MPSKEYQDKFAEAAYRTSVENFEYDGYLNEDNAPLEMSLILKKGIDLYLRDNPDVGEVPLGVIDFPSISSFPSFMTGFKAIPAGNGDYYVGSDSLAEVSFYIPAEFERVGDIVEVAPEMDVKDPVLPIGFIGDGRLDNAIEATDVAYSQKQKINMDDLDFVQAFERNRLAGKKTFVYRGEKYSADIDPFGADRTTGIPMEMNIPKAVREDPFGADFTGQMRPVDE